MFGRFHCIIEAGHHKMTTFMPLQNITAALQDPMLLGECPLWHPDENALYWIDIPGKAVHRLDPSNDAHRSWPLPSEPGCIARTESGNLLVAMRDGIAFLNTDSGVLGPLSPPPYNPKLGRFNDGRCDALGRLWVGTLYDPRDRPGGTLFKIEKGEISDAFRPVTVSNGVAFSNDSRVMYHADTTAHRITAYDFELATGTLTGGRVFQQFSTTKGEGYGGRPDGAAVDSEDAYWCAMFEGGRILRIAPNGNILDEIMLPVRCPTMLAFGGPDLRTIYITTARHNRPQSELEEYPMSGCVLQVRVDVPGKIEPPYKT